MENYKIWKLGCLWGKGEPSFYNVLKKHKVVIGLDPIGIYKKNELVLVTEGYNVLAIAKVKEERKPINLNKTLLLELKKLNVDSFEKISYYQTEFLELAPNEQFLYKLRQGIKGVEQKHIIKIATALWDKKNLTSNKDKRIMRLTWNKNNWEKPSGHSWHPDNRTKDGVAHENQYGYGHEEWLFDERFRIDGFQYGYINGISRLAQNIEQVDEIVLYTFRPNKQRCLVGTLYDVEVIEGYEPEEQKIEKLLNRFEPILIEELKDVSADFERYKKSRQLPNIKFRWTDAKLFSEPMPVEFLDGARFNRFRPNKLDVDLQQLIEQELSTKDKFKFKAGKAKHTAEYEKSGGKSKQKVKRRHGEITDRLYAYLIKTGANKGDVSIEKARIGGATIDAVLDVKNGYILFEVKTSNTALKNIRQALGQILEYALLDGELKCKKLVIIGPAEFKENEKKYFKRLKENININLEYWAYLPNEKSVEKCFLIYNS